MCSDFNNTVYIITAGHSVMLLMGNQDCPDVITMSYNENELFSAQLMKPYQKYPTEFCWQEISTISGMGVKSTATVLNKIVPVNLNPSQI